MTDQNNTLVWKIANMSNEKLEDQIASIYQNDTNFRSYNGVARRDPSSVLGGGRSLSLLWAEFDHRFVNGLIPDDIEYDPEED